MSETSAKQSKDIRGLKSDKATLVKKLQAVNDEKQLQMELLEKHDEGEQEQQKKHKRQVQERERQRQIDRQIDRHLSKQTYR